MKYLQLQILFMESLKLRPKFRNWVAIQVPSNVGNGEAVQYCSTVDKNLSEILDISFIESAGYNAKTQNMWEQMSSHASANRYSKPFLETTF